MLAPYEVHDRIFERFQLLSYSDFNIIDNLGSQFNFYLFTGMGIVSIILLKIFSRKYKTVMKVYLFFADRLLFNLLLRMLLEGFLEFFIEAWLNLYCVILLM